MKKALLIFLTVLLFLAITSSAQEVTEYITRHQQPKESEDIEKDLFSIEFKGLDDISFESLKQRTKSKPPMLIMTFLILLFPLVFSISFFSCLIIAILFFSINIILDLNVLWSIFIMAGILFFLVIVRPVFR